MLWDKGIGDYIEAIKILQNRKIECTFLLAGNTGFDNPSSIPIEIITLWEKRGYIKYLGFVTDIISLYQNSNIICLPSYREGLPKTLVEAGACSRVSVTTDVPGCRNIISNSFNGYVVPVKNPLELANALDRLINNPNERFLMATNARKHIELNFTYHVFYKRLNHIYFD
jgi:glycosyltransferase involved in cell wall biosynthesis